MTLTEDLLRQVVGLVRPEGDASTLDVVAITHPDWEDDDGPSPLEEETEVAS